MSQNLKSIFIDGEAGTTGLGIRERLADVPEVVVKSIDPDKRKDPGARKAMMAGVDLVVLCLPDDAAKESVALADELGTKAPKIVDASTAHRVAQPGVDELVEDGVLDPQPERHRPGVGGLRPRDGRRGGAGCHTSAGRHFHASRIDGRMYAATLTHAFPLSAIEA